MRPGVTIRRFRAEEGQAFVAVNDAVGWRERRSMFDFHRDREDSCLLAADVGGVVVGCGGATVFAGAPPTGWVHSIVVRPECQRTGLGARLTLAAMDWLRARGAASLLLLATESGRPVYERLGFVAGERYAAFPWPADDADDEPTLVVRSMTADDITAALALDREATGEDRRAFLASFAAGGWVASRDRAIVGFHLPCPWGAGPTIARDPSAGLALLRRSARGQSPTPPRPLGLPEVNAAAVRYLAARGCAPQRHVVRMWRGAPPSWRPEMVFGVVNFAVG